MQIQFRNTATALLKKVIIIIDSIYIFKYNSGCIWCLNKPEKTCGERIQKANIFTLCINTPSGYALFLVPAFFFFFFFSRYENYGLTLRLPTSMPISTGSTSYGQAENTHHWPATVSMETTVSFPPWESVNSEWTWDDSYKLFPNLVIFHFHAGMDIGLQVCREWREEVFMVWHFSGVHGMLQYELSSPADVLWNAHENHHT